MMSLKGKTLFITGASRGIGLALAIKAAEDGANIVVAAKTATPHKHLPGTIYTAAADIERAGGQALPLVLDVRDESQVQAAVDQAVLRFGGIDICVNNASAIGLTGLCDTQPKKMDLMQQVNVRGSFLVSRACVPHLKRAANPHILTLSPPLNLSPEWMGRHIAYTISKYSMTLLTLGMAEEFRMDGIACNTLWPISTIDTSAVRFGLGGESMARVSRKPAIMADAAYTIVCKSSRTFSGQMLLDELLLRAVGVSDFARYAVAPRQALQPDLFVSRDILATVSTSFLNDSP